MSEDVEARWLTQAVIAKVSGGMDPRLAQIGDALIRHLHAFIREIRPTQAEWEAGIDFLTRTGQLCSDVRQEFILLSDTLGVSMLVDAINHSNDAAATESTVFGPFYHPTDESPQGADISRGMTGSPLFVCGRVLDNRGNPIADAIVDAWHADAEGFYDVQIERLNGGDAGRAWFRADHEGRFHFWTIRPSPYPIPNDGPVGKMLEAQGRHPYRPAHIHFMIRAKGFRKLVTHLFEKGSPYLDSDVVFGVKPSLISDFLVHEGGTAPDGREVEGEWRSLERDFVLASA